MDVFNFSSVHAKQDLNLLRGFMTEKLDGKTRTGTFVRRSEVMKLDVRPEVTRTEMRRGEPGVLSAPTLKISGKPLHPRSSSHFPV